MQTDKGIRNLTSNLQTNKGFILYWTIHTGIFPVTSVTTSAHYNQLPTVITETLSGAEKRTAWHAATRIKNNGIPSLEKDKDCTAKYLTKEAGDDVRILVREKIDKNNIVCLLDHIGVLSFDGSFQFNPDPKFQTYLDEAGGIINAMVDDYHKRIGNFTDVIIRNVLVKWLITRHRIIIRDSGGVYYLPNTGPIVENEIMAIHAWMLENSIGQLYSFEIFDTSATSLDGLIEQATQEIDTEALEMETKITGLIASYKADLQKSLDPKTMAQKTGSLAYTMEQYTIAIAKMKEKLAASEGSLGAVLGELSARMAMMGKQAEAVRQRAATQTEEYRKVTGKPQQLTRKQKANRVKRQIAAQGRKII